MKGQNRYIYTSKLASTYAHFTRCGTVRQSVCRVRAQLGSSNTKACDLRVHRLRPAPHSRPLTRQLDFTSNLSLFHPTTLHARRDQGALPLLVGLPAASKRLSVVLLRKPLHARLELGAEMPDEALDRPREGFAESCASTRSVNRRVADSSERD